MSQTDPSSMSRTQQIRETYRITKQTYPRLGLVLLSTFIVGAAVGFGLFWIMPGGGIFGWVMSVVGALLLGLLFTTIIFSRRAKKAGYARLDGQIGAAYAALTMLRRGWNTSQAVAVDARSRSMVHRVVGPPGIVLVGEGESHSRVSHLIAGERRKTARVVPDTPVHELICGDGEDEVPLPELTKKVTKLGRQVHPAEITDVLNRLKALDNTRGKLPLPKGPIPTNMKGMRQSMKGR